MPEENNIATDADRVDACRYLLNVYFKSKTAHTESAVLYTLNDILYAETKSEIQEKMKEFAEEK